MKKIARNYVCWPKLDADLKGVSKSCKACQEVWNSSAAAPLHPWVWLTKPWVQVQVDLARPFLNKVSGGHQCLLKVARSG